MSLIDLPFQLNMPTPITGQAVCWIYNIILPYEFDRFTISIKYADPNYWTSGVAHFLLAIVLKATLWNNIYQIWLLRNYVYMIVDLEKKSRTQQ